MRHAACPQEIKSRDEETGTLSNCETIRGIVIETRKSTMSLLKRNSIL